MIAKNVFQLLTLLVALFCASCQALLPDSMRGSKGMKAKDYFENEIQIHFLEAVARGEERKMDALLAKGADVNAIGREEMRPLFWALAKQSITGFKFLLEHNADPNIQAKPLPKSGAIPSVMELAAIMEDPQYLSLALKHGGNPNSGLDFGQQTVIYAAIKNHRIENVRALIKGGADVNHRDVSGYTPAMEAAAINQYDIVYLLLEAGADAAIKNRWNNDLAELIKRYGDRGIQLETKQNEWYFKVISELKRRGLM